MERRASQRRALFSSTNPAALYRGREGATGPGGDPCAAFFVTHTTAHKEGEKIEEKHRVVVGVWHSVYLNS